MPRKLLLRYMPDHETIRTHKCLRCFGVLLHKPSLWHLNRRSVATAFAVGLFFAFVPLPFQMVLAAGGAILFNGNLPISVAMVWLTNPLTMPPIFYVAYLVGAWILNVPKGNFNFDNLSLEWLHNGLASAWQPFLLGCLVLGAVSALTGYVGMHLAWRTMVLKRWRRRHHHQLSKLSQSH
ncbi:DUF2062 domain-containing protein [Mariprofundus ferrooxydans]|uniref:DUF2062 domain-containing protein n=1 Tax=Mariprofundus ferrooxydans TaxID=314344 RepID=UPI0014308853|nr:DUF2062 domain-containing protein [Mariprofundus ferrooxydans]